MVSRRRNDDDVPRLPRGTGLRLSWPEIVRIVLVASMLVTVLVLQRPCAEAVGNFIGSFDPPDAGPAPAADAGAAELPSGYVQLRGDMTEEQLRRAVDEARAKAHGAGPAPVAPPPPAPPPPAAPAPPR